MEIMRKLFHERLDQLAAQLNDMVVLVEKAMHDATTALFTADPAVAQSVIQGHHDVKAQQVVVDDIALAVATKDAAAVMLLDHDDDRIDQLQQDLHRTLLAGTPGLDVEVAVELALVSRYYERYADHAVDLGRGIAYLAGGTAFDVPTERV